jgi:hypothetical protein
MISSHQNIYIPVNKVDEFQEYLLRKSIRVRSSDSCLFEVKRKTGWKSLPFPRENSIQVSCKGSLGELALEFMVTISREKLNDKK